MQPEPSEDQKKKKGHTREPETVRYDQITLS